MLYIGVVSCTQESLESTFSNNQLNDDIFVIVPDTSSTLSKEKAARMACDLLSISTRDESKVSPYNSDNEYTIDRYNYLIRK